MTHWHEEQHTDQYGAFTCRRHPEAPAEPTISVVLAVKDGMATLEEAVRSIMTQTFTDFEFIAIDDGSTDDSGPLLEALQREDPRLVVIRQDNIGLTRSLNRGLSLSKGRYIARQDADDLSLPERFRKQMDYLEQHPDIFLLGCAYRCIDASGQDMGPQDILLTTVPPALKEIIACYNPFFHSSVIFRNLTGETAYRYNDTFRYAQDYELWLRIAGTRAMANLEEVLSLRRYSPSMIGRRQARSQRWYAVKGKLRHMSSHALKLSFWRYLLKDLLAISLPSSWKARLRGAAWSSTATNSNSTLRVLMLSVRADHGGGPEHMEQLMRHADEGITFFAACPREKPYWERFSAVMRREPVAIPHRRFTPRTLWKLKRYIQDHRIHMIHAHGNGAGVYGRFLSLMTGRPCVYTPHGVHADRYPRVKRLAHRLYECLTDFGLHRLIFVSSSEREKAHQLHLWRGRPWQVIENGVSRVDETQRQAWRQEQRQAFGFDADLPVVATITRYDEAKNMAEALEVASGLPECRFLWIGDGPDREILEEQAEKRRIGNIVFAGFRDDPRACLACADLYLSTSRAEGMPLGILEAMSVGLPIIASDVSGNRDVVLHQENGFLYPLGRSQLAADHIRQLLRDRLRHEAFGRRSRSLQRASYSAQQTADLTCGLYRSVFKA